MRIDEFSRQELTDSQATVHELTSQIKKLQERVNLTNDSREFQDVESVCSGRLSHVPRQPAIVPSPRGVLSRDQSLRPDTWNLLGTSGNVFDSPLAPIDSVSTPFRGMLHSWNLNATDGDLVRPSTGRPVARSEEQNRNTAPTPRFARRPRQQGILSFQQKECIRRIVWFMNKNFRSRSFILTNFPHVQLFHVGR